MDEVRISPAGDPFSAKEPKREDLRVLEESYRHELLDDEEREELRERIVRLRRTR